ELLSLAPVALATDADLEAGDPVALGQVLDLVADLRDDAHPLVAHDLAGLDVGADLVAVQVGAADPDRPDLDQHVLRSDLRDRDALRLAARGAKRLAAAVLELVTFCVRRDRRVWRQAVRVPLAGGTPLQRLGGAAAVVRARFSRGS